MRWARALLRGWRGLGSRRSAAPDPSAWRPALPSGHRVYAIGDVHGRADLLAALFDRIDRHRAAHPCPTVVDVLLGDLVDRGPESRRVVEILLERRRSGRVVAVMGNHERMMLNALERPDALVSWLAQGGRETLLSYGVDVAPPLDARRLEALRVVARDAIPTAHRDFLAAAPASFVLGDYAFVHAGIRPGTPIARQEPEDLLWIRDAFLDSRDDHGVLVVHGHTPTERPQVRPNRINLDTGAYVSGCLTCLVVEGREHGFLQARAGPAVGRGVGRGRMVS